MNINFRVLVPLFFLVFCSTCSPRQCRDGTITEVSLRNHAIKTVLPEFPYEAQAQRATGVAVAQVFLDTEGALKSVKVLQSPHPSINQAMLTAINQWVFEVNDRQDQTPICFNGKLTFYFVIENSKPYVRLPQSLNK